MAKETVKFKGAKDGVFVYVNSATLEEAKRELHDKFEKHGDFYRGVQLINVASETLNDREIVELKLLLRYKYDLIVLDGEFPEDVFVNKIVKKEAKEEVKEETEVFNEHFEGIDCGVTKFVYGTIRSGQEVSFNGNIVIVGDVNPGAFVIANGNLIVMGNFRGVAHVGANGNENAILACYNLQPIQVRIANTIAIKPDEEIEASRVPEIVMIRDGKVVIEPYLPNK